MAVYAKHRQVLRNTKRSLLPYFETIHFRRKIVIPPLRIVLRYQELSETPIGLPHEIFLGDQKLSTYFCDTPLYSSPKISHPKNGQRQKLSETPDTSRSKFSTFFGDNLVCFTETFTPNRGAVSILTCFQLVLDSVYKSSVSKAN